MPRLLAIALLTVSAASAAWCAGMDSDANTVQADLAAAATRAFSLYHNDLFPGCLFHTTLNTLYMFRGLDSAGLSAPTHMAWSENGAVRVAKAPCRTTARLSEPWVVVWFNGGRGWDGVRFIRHGFNRSPSFNPNVGPIDVPWLVVLQRPARVSLDASGLSLEADRPLGYVGFLPLFGSEKLRPSVTAAWERALPAAVIRRARLWTSLSRRYPVYVREEYQVDEQRDEVRIRNTFDYLQIRDAWGTKPIIAAPVSPVVSLAQTSGFRIRFSAPPTDLNTVTHWGPYRAVIGKDSYTYTVSGILKYIDEEKVVTHFRENTPGFAEARALLVDRMRNAASGGADPRGAYSIDWGMGMLGAWMRATSYVPNDIAQQMRDYIKRENLLNGYFLNPSLYNEIEVPISPKRSISILAVKPRQGLQTYGDDLVKQTSRMPYVVWQYGHYSGDWQTVRAKYNMVKRMYGFNLLLGWSCVGPEYTAEHAKISAKQGPIGLARLAKQFGDQPTYDYGAYLLAKALINEWAWDNAAVPYATKHAPWFHPTTGDWIMHENHGYVGLQGLPLDQPNTYEEIPLVLDRFNREELQRYNDYYVRMRHKYFPNQHMLNVYVTDYGDAPSLKALLAKPLTELITPSALQGQSHLTPLFYNYPVDVMELAGDASYRRLYPKGKQRPVWRRGLDALSRGQSWRQMAIAMRKDWETDTGNGSPWPYPAWYLMNPPLRSTAFSDDALPFGYVEADLTRRPINRTTVRSNWNSYLTSADVR